MKTICFTIVTPCFNRPDFLEETISSVVSQKGAFEIEYIVQDGGSDPAVIEILEYWKNRIDSGTFEARCTSLSFEYYIESDSGMYDAINSGFKRGSGDVMAWINSDDIYFPGAFDTIQQILSKNPEIDWLVGQTACINASDAVIYTEKKQRAIARRFVRRGYYRADIRFFNWLPQDSIFWRRSLWEKAGPLEMTNRLVSDFKLWQSFAQFANPVKIDSLLGAYRQHGNQLTAHPDAYKTELGPPPRVPVRIQFARGCGRAMPRLFQVLSKVPGFGLWLKILGLESDDAMGRMFEWDYQNQCWVLSYRTTLC